MHHPPASRYRSNLYYLAALLVILLIAYWPISFYQYSLKNDALNYFLPVRRLVSESFHHGIIPFWTPYMNLGYPLHGDMQSGVWNPLVQLLSLFGPYTLFTLIAETLIYIYLSGAGIFFLLKYFNVHPYANMLAAVAYMLCGFNTDGCQFPNWIAGAACLPFLVLCYYRCISETSFRHAIYSGLMFFLLFTCAYPADFILSAYLVLALLVWQMVRMFKRGQWKTGIKKMTLCQLLLAASFLVLSGPAIRSYQQSLPLTQRGMGASYTDAMSNPLHPLLISAYTTPLSTWKMPYVTTTDPLERNSYMGIVGFIFLWCAFLVPGVSLVTKFCRIALIVFFIFSLGEIGGLRIVSYYILPWMDSFRHSANAKIFTLFFSCVLAASACDRWMNNSLPEKKIRKALTGVIIMAIAVLIWGLLTPAVTVKSFDMIGSGFRQHVKERMDRIGFRDVVVAISLLQLPFLYFSWSWLLSRKKPVRLIMLGMANSMLFCILAQPISVVKNERASAIQHLINEEVKNGYPVPDAGISLSENSRDGMQYFREIGVLNLYNKKPGRVDYRISPSNLTAQNEFWEDSTLRETVMSYPIMYKTDSAIGSWPPLSASTERKYVLLKNDSLRQAINRLPVSQASIAAVTFNPNFFQFRIRNASPAYFVLLQNFYPGWTLTSNGQQLPIDQANKTFMSFMLPAGDHLISFKFDVSGVKLLWCLSLGTLALIIFDIIRQMLRPANDAMGQ